MNLKIHYSSHALSNVQKDCLFVSTTSKYSRFGTIIFKIHSFGGCRNPHHQPFAHLLILLSRVNVILVVLILLNQEACVHY